jgi:hypothetical protein
MATKRTPPQVNDLLRPKFGIPAVLNQSDRVVKAFGPRLGFTLMVMALVTWAAVNCGAVLVVARGITRVAGG